MALVVGTNSYVTVAEADDYLTSRINSQGWFDLSETGAPGEQTKESLLGSSFYWLSRGTSFNLPEGETTDQNIKQAQIEGALYLLKYSAEHEERLALQSQGVKSFKLSKRSESFGSGTPSGYPFVIIQLLGSYSNGQAFFDLNGNYDV